LTIVPDAALVLDHRGRVTLANLAAERLFDRVAYEAGERRLAQLVACPLLVESLQRLGERGATPVETFEMELGPEGPRQRWFHASARAWTEVAEGTGPATVVAVLRDVSRQKTAQRRSSEFVSGVSHEMKTPLAAIKAYVELLADGDAEDIATQQEFLGVINSQADRLLRLVESLLMMAQVEAATAGEGRRQHPLNPLLADALTTVEAAAAAKQIALVSDLDPQAAEVLADRRLLTHAVVQLLSNAINYTGLGGTVVLRSRAGEERVRIEIEDNGVGLGPDDRTRIFEKFYRVAKYKEMAAGTGLGLPLARHIVENLHGGLLSVESQLGTGSLFAVELGRADLNYDSCHSEGIADGQPSLAVR
jgi:two-component system phosphate regulon sensor histidine kinase PhoR